MTSHIVILIGECYVIHPSFTISLMTVMTTWVNRSGKSKNDREQNCKNNKNKSKKE